MEFVQDRITSLHDFDGHVPDAPINRATVVVPMTERDHAVLATERLLTELERTHPTEVIVALRAQEDHVSEFYRWLNKFDIPLTVLWCGGEALHSLLASNGLDGEAGKGRDVWLAVGVASQRSQHIICHDADTKTFVASDIAKLVYPLDHGFTFSKAYYARIENNRLYGRLFRLLLLPLIRALSDLHSNAILDYLDSFRYALAGEFGVTASLATELRFERRFGLEIGILGDAFTEAGFTATAQVDLGRYEHDHRSVSGPTGLVDMSDDVAAAFFRVVEEHGVRPDYDSLPDQYIEAGRLLIEQYAADSAFNGLSFDPDEETEQVAEYATAIRPPCSGDLLPAWSDCDIDPHTVLDRASSDLEQVL